MASSPSSHKRTESVISSSSFSSLPPNIYFSSQHHIPNNHSGFQTAPSSPAPAPSSTSTTFSADVLLQSGPLTQVSSPLSSQTTKPFTPLPAVLDERDALPSHHLLKIKSFSKLSKLPIEKFSNDFEAGGYKWNFSIYPTGDKSKDGEDHISVYLEIAETSTLPTGWEVNAIFNFFVFDQIRDKYVGPQDAIVRRFHCMKKQWGIVKFIDLETFNNPYNGYLVNDTCSFGVEVFTVKTNSKAECLSLINSPITRKISLSFSNVSKPTSRIQSGLFPAGDYKWRVLFYANGCQLEGNKTNNIVSLFLVVDASTLAADTKLLVHYTFRMHDKRNGNYFERSDMGLFDSSPRGFREFMTQTKFKDIENGYVVGDTCHIDVELKVLGLVKVE
uniref:MATH domain-containing protein n=2 Tax=Cannabis sativa TaxID=3483 RepID=A0A803PE07_CANSA